MYRLHGFNLSNYYNSVKLGMIEKGVDFEEVENMPRQDADFKAISPMGKVPCLEVDGQYLTEANVIYDLLEDRHPETPLYPADPFARAKAKELVHYIELYIDLPARRHIPSVFLGAPRNDAAVEEVRPALENGLAALRQLARFDPFVAGSTYGYADIAALFHIGLASQVIQAVYDWDIIAEVPGLAKCLEQIGERPAAKRVLGDLQTAMAALQG